MEMTKLRGMVMGDGGTTVSGEHGQTVRRLHQSMGMEEGGGAFRPVCQARQGRGNGNGGRAFERLLDRALTACVVGMRRDESRCLAYLYCTTPIAIQWSRICKIIVSVFHQILKKLFHEFKSDPMVWILQEF